MAQFNLNDYITVQDRINRFWHEYPDGAIRTDLASDIADFKTCRYRAEVFKHRDHPRPDAVGYAFEIAGQGMANKTSHEENAETSAIGRALANLGYATSQKDRPSREEMTKVSTHQSPPVRAAPATTAPDRGTDTQWQDAHDKLVAAIETSIPEIDGRTVAEAMARLADLPSVKHADTERLRKMAQFAGKAAFIDYYRDHITDLLPTIVKESK